MDQYFIHNLQKNYVKEINEDEFKQLQEAKNKLFHSFVLEEKLEFLLMNYAEIEKEAFSLTLDYMMTHNKGYEYLHVSNSLKLKVFQFLSTHKFYEDTVKSTLKSIYGRHSGEYKIIENKFSSEYNNPDLFYRTISIIRNHAQHYDLPIEITKFNYKSVETNDGKKYKYNLQFCITVASLENNRNVSKELLNDIKNTFSEKIDLMFLIRNYLESIGKIHEEIRKVLKLNLEKWEKIMMDTIDNNYIKYKQFTESESLFSHLAPDETKFQTMFIKPGI
ncbi:MAG: hypothetical protein AB4060_20630 [Crocosphaera sp.]